MKDLLIRIAPDIVILVFLTAVSIAWFCFLILKPDKWSRWTEMESAFYVRKRLLSPSVADRMKRFAQGLGAKLVIGFCVLLGIGALIYTAFLLMRFAWLRHQ
jgi:hypothetical protein